MSIMNDGDKEKIALKKHDEVVKKLQGGIEKYSCNQCEKKFCRR